MRGFANFEMGTFRSDLTEFFNNAGRAEKLHNIAGSGRHVIGISIVFPYGYYDQRQ